MNLWLIFDVLVPNVSSTIVGTFEPKKAWARFFRSQTFSVEKQFGCNKMLDLIFFSTNKKIGRFFFGQKDLARDIFGRELIWPKHFSTKNICGRKKFRMNICRPKNVSTKIKIRSKNVSLETSSVEKFSAEKLAVRIAEGGSNGGVRGWLPTPRSVRRYEKSTQTRHYMQKLDSIGVR